MIKKYLTKNSIETIVGPLFIVDILYPKQIKFECMSIFLFYEFDTSGKEYDILIIKYNLDLF